VPSPTVPALTESPVITALKRRLATREFTKTDLIHLGRVERLRALRAEGKSFEICGRVMEENGDALQKFAKGEMYACYAAHLEAIQDAEDERAMERQIRRGRIDMSGMVPAAVRFLQRCFREAKDGTPLDTGLAQWATQQVTKSTGLMEPLTIARPAVVNNTFIQQTLNVSREDDDQAAQSARSVVDVTPVSA
jgi:hypothetical protein